jgi:hypothetical protein
MVTLLLSCVGVVMPTWVGSSGSRSLRPGVGMLAALTGVLFVCAGPLHPQEMVTRPLKP